MLLPKSLGIILLGLWIFGENLMAICFYVRGDILLWTDAWQTDQTTDSGICRPVCLQGSKNMLDWQKKKEHRKKGGWKKWREGEGKGSIVISVCTEENLRWIGSYLTILNSPWFDTHWSELAGRIWQGFNRPVSNAHSKYGEYVRVLYRLC